jgi:hypothetical protein
MNKKMNNEKILLIIGTMMVFIILFYNALYVKQTPIDILMLIFIAIGGGMFGIGYGMNKKV